MIGQLGTITNKYNTTAQFMWDTLFAFFGGFLYKDRFQENL